MAMAVERIVEMIVEVLMIAEMKGEAHVEIAMAVEMKVEIRVELVMVDEMKVEMDVELTVGPFHPSISYLVAVVCRELCASRQQDNLD